MIYISHIMACFWLHIGKLEPCKLDNNLPWDEATNYDSANCTASWIYQGGFELLPYSSQYIFAFYWIFEVITTVGYGDYSGAT